MSYGGDSVREDLYSRPRFSLVMRGYDKFQVDQFASAADNQIASLTAERDRAAGQIQSLAAQLQQLQKEVTELRKRPVQVDKAALRDIGPFVDQILDGAEKQAAQITGTATERATKRQAEAENALVEAREQAAKILHDLEVELAGRRTEEEKAHEQRRAAAQAELDEVRGLADKLRADGEAARDRAEQEVHRLSEQGAQQLEQARAQAKALVEAACAQAQRETEAAHAKTQRELAQKRAEVEREINERRTAASQKIVALHAEAQQHAADVRQRAEEQAAAHSRELAAVVQEIETRKQELTGLLTELETAQQRLAESQRERVATDEEVTQLQQRLVEVRQELTTELTRLDESRRGADAAERHAKEVRARVQREAKRVAELAAAAVMAAAAGGAETGEYPQVAPRPAGPASARAGDGASDPKGRTAEPDAEKPASDNGSARRDGARPVPSQRDHQQPKNLAARTD